MKRPAYYSEKAACLRWWARLMAVLAACCAVFLITGIHCQFPGMAAGSGIAALLFNYARLDFRERAKNRASRAKTEAFFQAREFPTQQS